MLPKLIPLLGIILLLTSCYSNPEDIKKIKELENKVIDYELNINSKNKIIVDVLKGEWFSPDAAARNIIFYIDDTYRLSEGTSSSIIGGNYNIDGNKIILENSSGDIQLELKGGEGDDINFYLSNDDGEYFVKN